MTFLVYVLGIQFREEGRKAFLKMIIGNKIPIKN